MLKPKVPWSLFTGSGLNDYGARAWADVAPWWGDVLRRCAWIYANDSDKNQPTDFLVWGPVPMIFRFFDSLASELSEFFDECVVVWG